MKNALLKWMSEMLLVIGFSISQPVSGQYELQKMTFQPIENWTVHARSKTPKTGFRHFGLFRFQQAPAARNFEKLNQLGVQAGKSVSKEIFILGIPAKVSTESLLEAGIIQFSAIGPENRCEPGLLQKSNLGFEGEITIQILPHSGNDQSGLENRWPAEFGTLLEVWPGKVPKYLVKANVEQIRNLSQQNWILYLEEWEGEDIPFNQTSAAASRTSFLQSGLNGLDGKGIGVGIGDGGMVATHADLEGNQTNLTSNKISSFADHQDHVTGTIGGKGLLQANKKGMAPEAKLYNLQSSAVLSLILNLKNDYNVRLTNNSYGVNLNCNRAGTYNATSVFLDEQARQNPDILHVFAAGNQGSTTCGGYPGGYFNLAEGYPISKNCLTVGAVTANDEGTWFSSKGPTRDGRVKPEIVAMGNDLVSTVPSDGYGIKSGTSMAAPGVTGTLALLAQHFKNLNNQNYPESALLKALVCNSADDLGNPNVDFAYGYGRINARKAKAILDQNQYRSGTLLSNGLQNFSLTAPAGAKGLKVMISWTDPAGLAGSSTNLVHDLNLLLTTSSGQNFEPWVLNGSPAGATLAAQRGEDHLNNMEQVSMDVNPGEQVNVKVSAENLPEISQKYWLVYEWVMPELFLTSPCTGNYLEAGSNATFRWDLTEITSNNFILETSSDSLFGWANYQTISNPDAGFSSFTLPNSGVGKRFFRIKVTGGQGISISNVVGVFISPKMDLQTDVCQNHVRLSWTAVQGATRYELYELDFENGNWKSIGFTQQNARILSNLENGKRLAFAVKPWFSAFSGMISDGKLVYPGGSGFCPWANDLSVSKVISPQNARQLSQVMAQQNPVSIQIKNRGNSSFQNVLTPFYYQLNGGNVLHTNQLLFLSPGDSSQFVLPGLNIPATPGNYQLKVWFALAIDENHQNDTILYTFRQVANPPVTLPLTYNFENVISQPLTENTFALSSLPALDFFSKNESQLSTGFGFSPPEFGQKSLVLDKKIIDGKQGNSDLIFTLNLSAYAQVEKLALDFDWFPMGSLTPGNSLSIRANENDSWIELIRFWQESYLPKEVKSYRGIDLIALLNGQNPSATFQVKFSFSGLRPHQVANGQGYAIDNLSLSVPSKDVVIKRLISPVGGCVVPGETQKVKLKLFNTSEIEAQNIQIGYSLSGHGNVLEIIPSLAALDSIDFEFISPLPTGLVGNQKFKFWIKGQSDTYPANDTTRNIQVFFSPQVLAYPYYENFENGAGFWHSYGEKNQWEWGVPSKNLEVIDTAANGLRIWATNLAGKYAGNSLSYLESPCFDFSESTGLFQFSFNGNFQTENDYDFVWLEVSENGNTWEKVGQKGTGTNWYNHDSQQWCGNSGGWGVHSMALDVSQLQNKSQVRFRFGFSSDVSVHFEGAGIDDIHLEPSLAICEDSSFLLSGGDENARNWIRFSNQNGVVAEVENLSELGDIQLKMKNTKGGIRFQDHTPYLNRNFIISPENQPVDLVKVRLYLTVEDLEALKLADPTIRNFQNLGIYKYSGPNEDLNLANNSPALGQSTFISPVEVLKVPTAGGYFLEFSVASFSEFYISGHTLAPEEDLLPVKLLYFSARQAAVKESIQLEWKTASEVNADYFELAFSCDGKNFTPFHRETAKGKANSGFFYQVSHLPPACRGENLIYRLQQFDMGSKVAAFQAFSQIKNQHPQASIQILENPSASSLKLLGINGPTQISVFNASGKSIETWLWDENETQKDVSTWPAGMYFISIWSEGKKESLRFVKY
jgi:subtilisin family serine protease